MASFAIDPAVLRPLLPPGTELDAFAGRDYISIAGYLCRDATLFGIRVPFHRNFEEVSLRFYVRRKTSEGWRRGIVQVRKIVPRRTIAWAVRSLCGEPCLALPMHHAIEREDAKLCVEYSWRRDGGWESLRMHATGLSQPLRKGSIEEFLSEHSWGYIARPHGCSEYRVEHPRWSFWPASGAELECDVAALFGPEFAESLASPAAAAFVADGSEVVVGHRSACFAEDRSDLIADRTLPGYANPAS